MRRRSLLRASASLALPTTLAGCSALSGGSEDTPTEADESTPTQTTEVDHDPPPATPTETELGSDRFPTYRVEAVEGVQTDINTLTAQVDLDGAERITFVHDGEAIGEFTENDHRTFHESERPFVRTGEEVTVYGYWNGERHLLGTRVIEHQ